MSGERHIEKQLSEVLDTLRRIETRQHAVEVYTRMPEDYDPDKNGQPTIIGEAIRAALTWRNVVLATGMLSGWLVLLSQIVDALRVF